MRRIYFGLTGDKEDYLTANQTLFELGLDNMIIALNKKDHNCKATVLGISVTALNSFEMLFIFANKLKKVTKIYTENVVFQTSLDHYK